MTDVRQKMKNFALSFLVALAPSAALSAIGLFFAFSYGMAHGNGTPEWFRILAQVLWWPAMLLPQPAGSPILPIFLEATLGWAVLFALLFRLFKMKKKPNQVIDPTSLRSGRS